MAKSIFEKKLEKIFHRWSDYLPQDGVPMFWDEIKECIELSKKYKK